MTRDLHVYPKATLTGSDWMFTVNVHEHAAGTTSRFIHLSVGSISALVPLKLPKLAVDLIVPDGVTDSDVDDAIFVDDIRPGAQSETVWEAWRDTAETVIDRLTVGYTLVDFRTEWSNNESLSARRDLMRALVTIRGWTIPAGALHQHVSGGVVEE